MLGVFFVPDGCAIPLVEGNLLDLKLPTQNLGLFWLALNRLPQEP